MRVLQEASLTPDELEEQVHKVVDKLHGIRLGRVL